jgi:hypothetical protein
MRASSLAVGAAAVAVAALGAVPATAATPDRASGTPMCATSQLGASLAASDAAAGNLYYTLVITNHSSTTCHLTGYPGVSVLDSGGKQIGSPADRTAQTYAQVVLRSGGSASDFVHTANHLGSCQPTSAQMRVYPPGNRDSLVIPAKITVCHDFDITPLAAGSGGNPPGSGQTPTTAPSATPSPTQSSGAQVPVVPSGAPDTGLEPAAHSSGSHGAAIAAGAAGGALLLGGIGAGALRRRSRSQARG